jgi:hypothetical protein
MQIHIFNITACFCVSFLPHSSTPTIANPLWLLYILPLVTHHYTSRNLLLCLQDSSGPCAANSNIYETDQPSLFIPVYPTLTMKHLIFPYGRITLIHWFHEILTNLTKIYINYCPIITYDVWPILLLGNLISITSSLKSCPYWSQCPVVCSNCILLETGANAYHLSCLWHNSVFCVMWN